MESIITDRSLLEHARGYWSHQNVIFNPTDKIALLNPAFSMGNFADSHHELIKIIVSTSLTDFLSNPKRQVKKVFKTFDNEPFYSKLASKFIKKWLAKYQHNCQEGLNLSNIHHFPTEIAPLLVDWNSLKGNNETTIFCNLYQLSQLDISPKRFGYRSNELTQSKRYSIVSANITDQEKHLICSVFPFATNLTEAKQYYYCIHLAIKAACYILLWARYHKIILLPSRMKNVKDIAFSVPLWPNLDLSCDLCKEAIKANLHKLIIASTTEDIDDIPQDLQLHFPLTKHAKNLTKVLHRWLRDKSIIDGRELFPIDLLKPARIKSATKAAKWTPKWIEININPEWFHFCNIYWQNTNSPPPTKRSVIQHHLDWAWNLRKFNSPWDITAPSIWNKTNPLDKSTFYDYVEKLPAAKRSTVWNGSLNLFKVVVNTVLSSSHSPFMAQKVSSPFKTDDNPFKKSTPRSTKTHRFMIPTKIHEEMYNTLVSPGQNGEPTFSWAQNVYPDHSSDWVTLPDPNNPLQTIKIWCPSRTIALGILLTTPLRGVQVRWLDRGYMDNYIFDLKLNKMVENTHPLVSFKYENGNSHQEQYGRASGVLQTSDQLYDHQTEPELSIYVNTNKTQIYDPERTHGYPMPWPDGSKFLSSDDASLREKGRWLARVYVLLRYQLNWLNLYNPNPTPICFYDNPEDQNRVPDNKNCRTLLPRFTPVFPNLDSQSIVSCNINGQLAYANPPISKSMLDDLFLKLAIETENRLSAKGSSLKITKKSDKNGKVHCLFDIHTLRVTMITFCAEMGIPVHIIEEFLAGHQSIATTLHYLVHSPQYVVEKIYECLDNHDVTIDIDSLAEKLESGKIDKSELLIQHKRFQPHSDGLPDDIAAFVHVRGGICPMGGKGSRCHEGGLYEKTNHRTGESKIVFGQVKGGCGNCRFFYTGPDFIMGQVDTINLIMVSLLKKARERKQLSRRLSDLEEKIDNLSNHKEINKAEREFAHIKGQLHAFEEELTPLVIEWYNRYELLKRTKKIIADSDHESMRELIGGIKVCEEDYDSEAMITSEFELLRIQLATARITLHQGFPIPEETSSRLLRFLDQILAQIYPEKLLLSIEDAHYATQAAACVAGVLKDLVGDEAIQHAIDFGEKLALPAEVESNFKRLIDDIHNGAQGQHLPPPEQIQKLVAYEATC